MSEASFPSSEQPQAEQHRRIRLVVDSRGSKTAYANAFQVNQTQDEVMLDFGLNRVTPLPTLDDDADAPAAEARLEVANTVILNYRTAKRLAVTLSQIVRLHESQFGKLDVS